MSKVNYDSLKSEKPGPDQGRNAWETQVTNGNATPETPSQRATNTTAPTVGKKVTFSDLGGRADPAAG